MPRVTTAAWLVMPPREVRMPTAETMPIEAYLAEGGEALGVRAGESYVDVGTLDGYRSAMQMLDRPEPREGQARQGIAIAEPLGRSPAKPLAQ